MSLDPQDCKEQRAKVRSKKRDEVRSKREERG
jgi:hypothetical protein